MAKAIIVLERKTVKAEPWVIEVLRVAQLCVSLEVLPNIGGLLDQDYLLVIAMQEVLNAQGEKAKKDAAKHKGSSASR